MIVERYRDEYCKLHKDATDLVAKIAKANEGRGRDLTGEEKTAQEKRYARMDQIREIGSQEIKLAAYAFQQQQQAASTERAIATASVNPAAAAAAIAAAGGGGPAFASEQEFSRRIRAADPLATAYAKDGINHFLRTGQVPDAYKFIITTVTEGGIMLPKAVMAPYLVRRNVNAFRLAISYYGYHALETTTTDQITLPVWDDTSNIGQPLSESATTDDTADSTLTGSVTLNGTLYESGSKWFSNTLLNAEGFDVLSYVAPVQQLMYDKGQESAYTATAQGTSFSANYTVPATQVGIKYEDLLNWEHTLVPAYRRDAVFVLSDSLYKTLRGMVDGNNRPIIDLNPAGVLAQGEGPLFIEQIHGKPIAVSDYMTAVNPTVAAAGTLKTGLFISADAIKIRNVIPQRLTRYVNVPTYPDQTGYNLFGNGDCKFVANGGALFIY